MSKKKDKRKTAETRFFFAVFDDKPLDVRISKRSVFDDAPFSRISARGLREFFEDEKPTLARAAGEGVIPQKVKSAAQHRKRVRGVLRIVGGSLIRHQPAACFKKRQSELNERGERSYGARGHKVEFLKTTSEGIIDTDDLRRKLTPETALVCLMHTHNETGAVQPLSEAVQAVREFESGGKRIHFHCDAVQAGGKTAIDLTAADVDSASFSAHKFGGARGAGILFLKKPLQPLYLGGGQENGLRPGTENLPAVAAMTAALKNRNRCRDDETAAAREIRRKLTNAFSLRPEIVFPFPENGAEFSPYVMSIAVPGLPSEVAQRLFNFIRLRLFVKRRCPQTENQKSPRSPPSNCRIGSASLVGTHHLSLRRRRSHQCV